MKSVATKSEQPCRDDFNLIPLIIMSGNLIITLLMFKF